MNPPLRDSSGKPIRRGLVLALKSMILGLHTEAKTLSSREAMIQLYMAQVEQYLWLWHIDARLTWTNWREFREKCHWKGKGWREFFIQVKLKMYFIWLGGDLSWKG